MKIDPSFPIEFIHEIYSICISESANTKMGVGHVHGSFPLGVLKSKLGHLSGETFIYNSREIFV